MSGNVVLDRGNRARAFVSDGVVFNYRGWHRGHFEHGFFHDRDGHAVAFVEGALGGPLTPVTEVPPPPPAVAIALLPPAVLAAPIPPASSPATISWSRLDWEQFLS